MFRGHRRLSSSLLFSENCTSDPNAEIRTRELAEPTLLKILRDSWIIFDQTFQGLGLGTLFPARESLVSDILAGDGKSLCIYLQCTLLTTKHRHTQKIQLTLL